MHMIRPVFRIFLAMGICGAAWAGGTPEDINRRPDMIESRHSAQADALFSGRADWIYQGGDWVLNLYLTQKGTRSQGSHGILIFEGKEVSGTRGETRALPIGTVQYQGTLQSRTNLWDSTGWQMVDALVQPIVNEPLMPPRKHSDDPGKFDSDAHQKTYHSE
ncbi:MAG: hypothetical protein V6Z89_21235 [Desulfobacter sp.]